MTDSLGSQPSKMPLWEGSSMMKCREKPRLIMQQSSIPISGLAHRSKLDGNRDFNKNWDLPMPQKAGAQSSSPSSDQLKVLNLQKVPLRPQKPLDRDWFGTKRQICSRLQISTSERSQSLELYTVSMYQQLFQRKTQRMKVALTLHIGPTYGHESIAHSKRGKLRRKKRL